MSDCGKLDPERKKILFAVPDDHEVEPEQLEESRRLAQRSDKIVTPDADPLDDQAGIELDVQDELGEVTKIDQEDEPGQDIDESQPEANTDESSNPITAL